MLDLKSNETSNDSKQLNHLLNSPFTNDITPNGVLYAGHFFTNGDVFIGTIIPIFTIISIRWTIYASIGSIQQQGSNFDGIK